MGALMPSAGVVNGARTYVNTATVALSTTTAKSAALREDTLYLVTADVIWHFNHGAQASVTATTSHFKLAANQVIEVWSTTDFDTVAGILPSGTGNLYIMEVK